MRLYFFSDFDHEALEDTADARLFGLDVGFEAELDQQVQGRLSDSVLLFFLVRECAHFHAVVFVVAAFLIHEVIVAPAGFGMGYKETVNEFNLFLEGQVAACFKAKRENILNIKEMNTFSTASLVIE
jgi:hypothetical protein